MDVPIQDAKVLKMLLCLFCQKIDVQVLIHTLPPSVITDELESGYKWKDDVNEQQLVHQ